jgi:hypothetical protein
MDEKASNDSLMPVELFGTISPSLRLTLRKRLFDLCETGRGANFSNHFNHKNEKRK